MPSIHKTNTLVEKENPPLGLTYSDVSHDTTNAIKIRKCWADPSQTIVLRGGPLKEHMVSCK